MRHPTIEGIASAVTVLLLVGGCGWAVVTWGPSLACQNVGIFCPPAPGEEALSPFVEQYLLAAGPTTDPAEYMYGIDYRAPAGQQPYRVGRVAVVNVDQRAIDRKLTGALPADTVALHPAEVETVIWVHWGEHRVGTYHDVATQRELGEAYQGYCQIVVIDRAAGQIVGQGYFEAPSPPASTTSSGDIHTQLDVTLVANWVKNLPVHAAGASSVPSAHATPTTSPRPSDGGPPALEPGESLTISGDQSGSSDIIPEERFVLAAGDYSVVFEGQASKGCANCMAIEVFNERDEYPIFVVNDPDRIAAGHWRFTGVFTLAWWEDGASFHFELDMPKGSWTITLTRDS